jgi:NitT/TauT family transport system permease protein
MAALVTLRYALQRLSVIVAQLGAVVVFVLLWKLGTDHKVLDPVYFSTPSQVWDQLRTWFSSGTIWHDIADTLEVFIVGYVIGTALGVVLGVLIGTLSWLRQVAEPFLAFFNAMPRLILLPLLIVWFGFGFTPKIVLVVAVIVLMVTLNVAAGLREVRVDLLSNARLMGAGRLELVRHVYAPSIALWVTSTARVTVGYAFNATIAAEFIGANKGLGYLMYYGQSIFQVKEIYAALAITVVIAIVMDGILAIVENRATRWMPAT